MRSTAAEDLATTKATSGSAPLRSVWDHSGTRPLTQPDAPPEPTPAGHLHVRHELPDDETAPRYFDQA